MIVHRVAFDCFVFCVLTILWSAAVSAHGGVVQEQDLCIIKVNYLSAHFKIYQPRASGHKQYCEDLPAASESVFVMEYEHDSLSMMPIDFRIIRDVTGQGRFARMEDVERIENLGDVTVYYQPAVVEPDVYTIVHNFEDEGAYIGIVSATHPETDKVYSAVFPFEVGYTGLGSWPYIIALLVLLQIQYLAMSGRLRRWFGHSKTASVSLATVLLLFPVTSLAGDLLVTYTTPGGDPEINRMHSWILHIENEFGKALEGASIAVDGGMPEHNHGLPTKPRVTAELGGGDYRLDGVRFHMRGYWEIVVTITTNGATSVVTIPLQL